MTLIEVLVVMAIIGLILGISIPSFTRYSQQARLQATVRQVMALVSLARQAAISSHEDHAVVLDAEQELLQVINRQTGEALERRVKIPESVEIEMLTASEPADPPELVFRPTGSLSGRTTSLVISQDRHRRTVTVAGVTGAISLQ